MRLDVARECPQCGRLATRFNNDVCRNCNDANRLRYRKAWGPDGEPVAHRPRKHRRLPNAKLTTEQVQAAYILYCDRRSLQDVAELIWRACGFSSVTSCRNSLYSSFTLDGLPLRPPSAAHKLRVELGRQRQYVSCGRCGCPVDESTPGCVTCVKRLSKRRVKAGEAPPRSACSACGCPADERTRGCETCRQRLSKRRSRAEGFRTLGMRGGESEYDGADAGSTVTQASPVVLKQPTDGDLSGAGCSDPAPIFPGNDERPLVGALEEAA